MRLRPELVNLLQEVMNEQQPDLLPAVEQLATNRLPSRADAGRLIDLLVDEVTRTGFFETDESVKRGLMLEEIADFLGDAKYEESADG